MFNPAQLVTLDEARALVVEMNARGIGGGVLPESKDQSVSGIYIDPWDVQPDSPAPEIGEAKFYSLRFKNGAAGINVGLVLDKFNRYPTSPAYVWSQVAAEVDSMKTINN